LCLRRLFSLSSMASSFFIVSSLKVSWNAKGPAWRALPALEALWPRGWRYGQQTPGHRLQGCQGTRLCHQGWWHRSLMHCHRHGPSSLPQVLVKGLSCLSIFFRVCNHHPTMA
jgi:hypothetical protein